jgi:hypothetical protein
MDTTNARRAVSGTRAQCFHQTGYLRPRRETQAHSHEPDLGLRRRDRTDQQPRSRTAQSEGRKPKREIEPGSEGPAKIRSQRPKTERAARAPRERR